MTARTVSDAMMLAIQAMGPGRTDKGGNDYAVHLMSVVANTREQLHRRRMNPNDPEVLIAAVLHDVLEDTKVTAAELRAQGYTERTVNLVEILTRKPGIDYGQYLMLIRLSMLREAIAIKVADAMDNFDFSRLMGKEVTEDMVQRQIKYAMVMEFFRSDTAAEGFGALAAIELLIGGMKGDLPKAKHTVNLMIKGYAIGAGVSEAAASEAIQLESMAVAERAGKRAAAEAERTYDHKYPA